MTVYYNYDSKKLVCQHLRAFFLTFLLRNLFTNKTASLQNSMALKIIIAFYRIAYYEF